MAKPEMVKPLNASHVRMAFSTQCHQNGDKQRRKRPCRNIQFKDQPGT